MAKTSRIEVYIPDNDRILIKQLQEEVKSKGGIIIPDTAQEKPQKGIVIMKGPDVKPEIEVGQTILYGKYSGTEIQFNGIDFIVLRQSDVSGEILTFYGQDEADWDLEMMRPKKEITSNKK